MHSVLFPFIPVSNRAPSISVNYHSWAVKLVLHLGPNIHILFCVYKEACAISWIFAVFPKVQFSFWVVDNCLYQDILFKPAFLNFPILKNCEKWSLPLSMKIIAKIERALAKSIFVYPQRRTVKWSILFFSYW